MVLIEPRSEKRMSPSILAAQNTVAKDSVFIGRVESAIIAQAFAILAEPATTQYHEMRVAAAQAVLGSRTVYATMMAFGVATDSKVSADAGTTPPTQSAVLDVDITNAVAA